MSDLYRKEALAHRSRALFGDVRLQAPPATWLITALLLVLVAIVFAGAILLQVQTDEGPLRLIDWLFGA